MFDSLLSLVVTTLLLLGSPGPATLALAATGATLGFKKGLPFLMGILAGLAAAIVGASLGVASLFATWPELKFWVQILGALYIVFIAFKIATAPVLNDSNKDLISAPGFTDGFVLNLLNPKAYAAFFAIFSQFLLPFAEVHVGFIATGLVCFLVGLSVDIVWLYIGGLLKQVFQRERSARLIRITFALLMIVAVVFALFRV